MNELLESAAAGTAVGHTAAAMLPRLALALLLAGVIAVRPWRK